MNLSRSGAWCAAVFGMFVAALSSVVRAETDACTLLTPAQVSAAVGVSVGEGEHVTQTFVKTCTWKTSGESKVKFVTLNLQTAEMFDGGKKQAEQLSGVVKGTSVKSAGLGDDSYYFVTGDQVGLLVKKGSVAFKMAAYATLPVEAKEAMELALAKDVLTKL